MSSFKHLAGIVNGISLVAKEIARRSQDTTASATVDFQTLITSATKKVFVSISDVLGITKGKVRQYSPPKPKESVVYFDHSAEVAEPSLVQPNSIADAGNNNNIANDDDVCVEVVQHIKVPEDDQISRYTVAGLEKYDMQEGCEDEKPEDKGNEGGGEMETAASMAVKGTELKRRKPRERRVPSTPFSRALGSWLL